MSAPFHAPFHAPAASPAGGPLGPGKTPEPPAPNWLIEQFGPADADGTYGGLSLADVIHDFGPPAVDDEEDPDDTYDPSPAAMLREHCTWRL